MVIPVVSSIDQAVEHFMGRAREQLRAEGFVYALDAIALHHCAERTTNQLALAEQKDDTPEFLRMDGFEGVRWEDTLHALLAKCYVAMGAVALLDVQKPPPAKPPPTPLSRARDALDAVRRAANAREGPSLLRAALARGVLFESPPAPRHYWESPRSRELRTCSTTSRNPAPSRAVVMNLGGQSMTPKTDSTFATPTDASNA